MFESNCRRYAREMSLHALELLQLLTLHPSARGGVLAASVAPHRSGVSVLLHAAGTGHAGPPFYGLADPEVGAGFLFCVCLLVLICQCAGSASPSCC